MAINSINLSQNAATPSTSQQALSSSTAQAAASAAAKTSNGLAGTGSVKQVDQQAASSRVKLSQLGQVSSEVSKVRDAAVGLQDKVKTGTAADAGAALSSFVKSFNDQNTTFNKLTQTNGSPQGGAGDARLRVAATDVNRSTTGDSKTKNDLNAIGVSVQKDGSLKVDQKAFDAAYKANPDAVQSTLAKLGSRSEAASTRQLNGGVNDAQNAAKVLASASEQKQISLQAQAAATQKSIEGAQQSASSGLVGLAAAQVASYQKVFAL